MNIEVVVGAKRHHLQAEAGTNLMDCLVQAGLMGGTECGGRGVCGKCAVKVFSGELIPIESDQKKAKRPTDGRVLACLSLIKEDLVIELAPDQDDVQRKVRLPKLQGETRFTDTPVQKKFIQMSKPSLHDQISDIERILAETEKCRFPRALLCDLPKVLRESDFAVTAVITDGELIAVEPGDTRKLNYGFIVDIGTTTIAIYLVDLDSGEPLDAEGAANPQRPFGADVLSRITASADSEVREKMRTLTIETISEAMRHLIRRHNIAEENVYSLVAVGNTTMSHLFLGVDPTNLALSPFIPGYRPRISFKAADYGLPMHPQGIVHFLANIAGYVGSDTLGVAMATKPWEQSGYSLAVDIGTNGEIILGCKDWMLTCSTAAGPAFEGAHIHQGMRAGDGAIEKVRLDNDEVRLGVIGKTAPLGICGSGLIDAVAELVRVGLVDKSGKLVDEKSPAFDQPLAKRLRTTEKMREFVLAHAGEFGNKEDVVLTQKDIRELQLAKGAIAAGIRVLLKEGGIESSQVDRVFLAGAFGNYLDREKAVALGMFPDIPTEKIIAIGNAAAEGAGMCLVSDGQRQMSDTISVTIKPVELSTNMEFNNLFVRAIGFPVPAK